MRRSISVSSDPGERRKALLTLFLTIFVNLLGFGLVIPLLPFYGERMEASPLVIGWLFASYSLAQLVAAPILGDLSDRFGRRPVLIGSLVGTVVSFVLLAEARSITALFLSRIVDGLSGGNLPTARAYIADITPPEDRAKRMALIGVAYGLGFVLGPAMGGALSRVSLDAPAWAAAGLALVATVLAMIWLPETVHQTSARRPPLHVAIPAVFRHPALRVLLLVDFLVWASMSVYHTTFPLYGEIRFHWEVHQIGYILAFLGFLGALVQGGAVGRVVRRFGERATVSWGILLTAVGLGGASATESGTWFIVLLLPAVVGTSLLIPALMGLLSRAAAADEQGRTQGVSSALESLARAVGPVWGNGALGALGPGPAYLSAAAVLLLTWVISLKIPQPSS